MTGIDAADVAPDFLAVTIEIIQHVGTNSDVVELLQQAETGQFADCMRQRVDADAELPDGVGLLEQFAVDAAGPQHQRGGKAANSAPDDNRLHRPTPLTPKRQITAAKLAWPVTPPQAALSPPP